MPYYSGRIEYDRRVKRWIREHRSFASKEWLNGQVRYGLWERRVNNRFDILVVVIEGGVKRLRVVIRIRYFPNGSRNFPYRHVFVEHAHVLRKKK